MISEVRLGGQWKYHTDKINEQKEVIAQLTEQNSKLEHTLNSLRIANKKTETESKKLQETVDILTQSLQDTLVSQNGHSAQELEGRNESLKIAISNLETEKKSQEVQLSTLKELLDISREESLSLQNLYDKMEERSEILQTELTREKERIRLLEKGKAQRDDRLKILCREKEELREKVSQLQFSNTKLRQQRFKSPFSPIPTQTPTTPESQTSCRSSPQSTQSDSPDLRIKSTPTKSLEFETPIRSCESRTKLILSTGGLTKRTVASPALTESLRKFTGPARLKEQLRQEYALRIEAEKKAKRLQEERDALVIRYRNVRKQ